MKEDVESEAADGLCPCLLLPFQLVVELGRSRYEFLPCQQVPPGRESIVSPCVMDQTCCLVVCADCSLVVRD